MNRCYSTRDVLIKLGLARSTFNELKRRGAIPCLEELRPRIGRSARYRADLVDRYLAGQWGGPKAFRKTA